MRPSHSSDRWILPGGNITLPSGRTTKTSSVPGNTCSANKSFVRQGSGTAPFFKIGHAADEMHRICQEESVCRPLRVQPRGDIDSKQKRQWRLSPFTGRGIQGLVGEWIYMDESKLVLIWDQSFNGGVTKFHFFFEFLFDNP